jgi:hypothetical protein
MWRDMAVRALAVGAILATGVASAHACKGTTELLRDDFTQLDPAWELQFQSGSFALNGAKMVITSTQGNFEYVEYEGAFFPEGDFCADVTLPPEDLSQGLDNIFAGLVFGAGDGSYYVASVFMGGQLGKLVGVMQVASSGVTTPVAPGTFDALKIGAKASNTLRLTWKGPPSGGATADATVSFYVNDKLYTTFNVPPNANRQIGFAAATAGSTATIAHLLITK